MTKILMISDTHTRHQQIQGMEKADVLIHAGDITFNGEYEKLSEFNEWLFSLGDKFDGGFVHKIVIPGNHDLTFESDWETASSLISEADVLNQCTVEVGGLAIYGEPRQPEFCDWAFNVPRHNMKAVWDKVPINTNILVTHGPPFGLGDMTDRGEQVGCVYQREWIEKHQPALVVCGHIHEGHGIYMCGRTVVVNASICDERYNPTNRPVVFTI
jgi:Icc-related predicted phosphoesterase